MASFCALCTVWSDDNEAGKSGSQTTSHRGTGVAHRTLDAGLGGHIQHAARRYDNASRKLARLSDKLQLVGKTPTEELPEGTDEQHRNDEQTDYLDNGIKQG